MSIHIRVVTPATTRDERTHELVRQLASPGVVMDAVEIDDGPPSIETEADEALSIPGTLRRIVEAERAGVDAVVIDCMGDPGLVEARALVSIPVLGPSETSMHTAVMLGKSFGIVTVVESVRNMFLRLSEVYGVSDRVASFRAIDVPVLEIDSDPARVEKLLCDQSLKAVEDDGADVIVLGCTGFIGMAQAVARYLSKQTGTYIPVIDAIPLSIYTAIGWVRTNLAQSKSGRPPLSR